jgi:putative transposase
MDHIGIDVHKKDRVLRHHRRELSIGVTDQPTAAWAAQQIVHAFPDETGPAYLLRDRDAICGADFQRVERLGIRQVVIAPRAPWQNPVAERVIGSIRHECLDLVVVLSKRHLRRMLRMYTRVLQRYAASPESR